MKPKALINTDITPANDFADAATFIGPRQPQLKLVENEQAAAPVTTEEELVTIGNITLSPKASQQYRIQKAMLEEALAKAARDVYTPPPPPRDMTWKMMPMQQQVGVLLRPPVQQQPERRGYEWTQMKMQ